MLTQFVDNARWKVAVGLIAAASFLPSSSNEASGAQRDRAEATSSQTTTPRARTVAAVHPDEDRQGPELPFEKITFFSCSQRTS